MIRLLLLALLFFLGYTLVRAIIRSLPGGGKAPIPPEKTSRGEDMVRDPQCGTYVPRSGAVSATVRGRQYHFCSEECRDAFAGRK